MLTTSPSDLMGTLTNPIGFPRLQWGTKTFHGDIWKYCAARYYQAASFLGMPREIAAMLTARVVTVGGRRTIASILRLTHPYWCCYRATVSVRLWTEVSSCPGCRHVPGFRSTVAAARGNQARHSFGNFRSDVTWLCPVHGIQCPEECSRLQIPRA